ncbi:MAG: hypothetical protein LH702_20055 [Phormidesmis sp. CAN_BIN44]|nr:hypothetical protein [Phormidesmis sp. CAN_BIN44]
MTLLIASPALSQSARIDSVSSQVFLKRQTWSDFRPVQVRTEIEEKDQIRVSSGGKVRVACPNHRTPLWTSDQPIAIKRLCGGWALVAGRGNQSAATIGGLDPTIPYLISPRHTLLLSNTPTFRWNPVLGVTRYVVQVKSANQVTWETTVQQPQILYSGSPLIPGTAYTVTVKASNSKTSEQDGIHQTRAAELDFRVLRQPEANEIAQEVVAIRKSGLTEQVTALALAKYYGDYVLLASTAQVYGLSDRTLDTYSLTTDAISELEEQIKKGAPSTIIHRTLGNLYWQIGLAQPAIDHYNQAINLVQSSYDVEEWTLAQYGLGRIYSAISKPLEALNAYQQARTGFLFLGDTQRATVLDRRIDKLKTQ